MFFAQTPEGLLCFESVGIEEVMSAFFVFNIIIHG